MSLIQCIDINTLSCIRHRELYSPVFVPDTSVELDNMKSIVIKCIITNVSVLNCSGFRPMITTVLYWEEKTQRLIMKPPTDNENLCEIM